MRWLRLGLYKTIEVIMPLLRLTYPLFDLQCNMLLLKSNISWVT